MSCSRPFFRFNKLTRHYDSIPCGWCIKCRIDKRMYYKTRFDYSFYKEHKGVGSFVCVTYDDEHLPLTPFGEPTLEKSAPVNFIKRVRSYMKYHKINNQLIHRNFKYIAVGEYGDEGRPHYHFLFSGLDYAAAEPIFRKCWNKATIIDSRPILQGGVNYVLKYIDKQQHGSELNEQYFDLGKCPPFANYSHSFGFGVYKNGLDLNKGTFSYGAKDIPLPIYVKNKLLLGTPKRRSDKIVQFASKNRMSYDDANKFIVESQEHNFERSMRQHGEPVADVRLDGQFCFDLTKIRH